MTHWASAHHIVRALVAEKPYLQDHIYTTMDRKGTRSITCQEVAHYREILDTECLGGKPVLFKPYFGYRERYKYVIRKVPHEILPEEFTSVEGIMKGIRAIKNGMPTSTVIVTASRKLSDSTSLKGSMYITEPFVEQPDRCYACQRWGHNQFNCLYATRCYFCGSLRHLAKECQNRSQTLSCVNCGQSHRTAYAGCVARREELEKNRLKAREMMESYQKRLEQYENHDTRDYGSTQKERVDHSFPTSVRSPSYRGAKPYTDGRWRRPLHSSTMIDRNVRSKGEQSKSQQVTIADKAKVAGTTGNYADRVRLTPYDLRHRIGRWNTESSENDVDEDQTNTRECMEVGTQTPSEDTVTAEIFTQLAEMWKRLARVTDLIRQIPIDIKKKVMTQVKSKHEQKYAEWVGSIMQA